MRYLFVVPQGKGVALDRFLQRQAHMPLARCRDLIDFGSVYVDGKVEQKAERPLLPGQEIRLHVPRYGTRRFYETRQDRILYRDTELLAYDKEEGIPCQQTPYDAYNNVYAGLKRFLGLCPSDRMRSGPEKPPIPSPTLGMHHRLDKDVSGVMVFALSKKANRILSDGFRNRKVEKVYCAVVCGEPHEDAWTEAAPIGRKNGRYLCVKDGEGKEAETRFRVIRREEGLTLVEACPKTGRTHQIRLHLALRGLPILGDRIHEGRPNARCMLHAVCLSFPHPTTGERLRLQAPLPPQFDTVVGPQ